MTLKPSIKPLTFATIVASVIILSSCTAKYNWPQFRGPESNFIVTGQNLPTEWGKDTNVLWTYDFEGVSWSSPVIWGNKVFITSALGVKAEPLGIFESRPEPSPESGDSARAGGERLQGRQQQSGAPGPGQERPQGPPQPGGERRPGQQEQQAPPPPPPAPDTSYLQEIYRWEVTCLDLNTGDVLWKSTAYEGSPRTGINRGGSSYANETPATDGKRIYAYFSTIGMFCFDMEGKLLWKKDLGAYKTLMEWGTGSSPVVYQDVVYQQVDNEEHSFMIALDAGTGEEIWKAERDEKTTYSTPVIWKNSKRTELVASGRTALSYDLKTGKVLWQTKLGGEMCIPSPVPYSDSICLSNAGGMDSPGYLCMIKAGAEGDITPDPGTVANEWIRWANLQAGTGNPTPVIYKGFVYILAGRGGEVACFNAHTGSQVYKEKAGRASGVWASPWAAADNIGFMDERGLTTLIKAGDKFEVVAQNRLDDRFWASPAFAGNKYIFKGRERVYCVGK
jgi:outer membrane protein assembly factor BamB